MPIDHRRHWEIGLFFVPMLAAARGERAPGPLDFVVALAETLSRARSTPDADLVMPFLDAFELSAVEPRAGAALERFVPDPDNRKAVVQLVNFAMELAAVGGDAEWALVREMADAVDRAGRKHGQVVTTLRVAVEILESRTARALFRCARKKASRIGLTPSADADEVAAHRTEALAASALRERIVNIAGSATRTPSIVWMRQFVSAAAIARLATYDPRFAALEPNAIGQQLDRVIAERGQRNGLNLIGLAAKLAVHVDAFGHAPKGEFKTSRERKAATEKAVRSAAVAFARGQGEVATRRR